MNVWCCERCFIYFCRNKHDRKPKYQTIPLFSMWITPMVVLMDSIGSRKHTTWKYGFDTIWPYLTVKIQSFQFWDFWGILVSVRATWAAVAVGFMNSFWTTMASWSKWTSTPSAPSTGKASGLEGRGKPDGTGLPEFLWWNSWYCGNLWD